MEGFERIYWALGPIDYDKFTHTYTKMNIVVVLMQCIFKVI